MDEDRKAQDNSCKLQFARDAISKEVHYLREKEWRLFSWASSIQLGTIGGVIALAGIHGFVLPPLHRLLLAAASLILALYAFLWIKELLKREEQTLDILGKYDGELSIESAGWSIKTPQIGYTWTILLLEIAVLLTVLLVEMPK